MIANKPWRFFLYQDRWRVFNMAVTFALPEESIHYDTKEEAEAIAVILNAAEEKIER